MLHCHPSPQAPEEPPWALREMGEPCMDPLSNTRHSHPKPTKEEGRPGRQRGGGHRTAGGALPAGEKWCTFVWT